MNATFWVLMLPVTRSVRFFGTDDMVSQRLDCLDMSRGSVLFPWLLQFGMTQSEAGTTFLKAWSMRISLSLLTGYI